MFGGGRDEVDVGGGVVRRGRRGPGAARGVTRGGGEHHRGLVEGGGGFRARDRARRARRCGIAGSWHRSRAVERRGGRRRRISPPPAGPLDALSRKTATARAIRPISSDRSARAMGTDVSPLASRSITWAISPIGLDTKREIRTTTAPASRTAARVAATMFHVVQDCCVRADFLPKNRNVGDARRRGRGGGERFVLGRGIVRGRGHQCRESRTHRLEAPREVGRATALAEDLGETIAFFSVSSTLLRQASVG